MVRPHTLATARTPWAWALGGAALGLLLATVLFAPAVWLAGRVQAASGGQVLLQDARGTVWNGSSQITLTGGPGADIFHTFSGAGLDRVTDFSRAEGDRVFVLGTYTVSQVGSDVVIDLTGGTQMVLVGVQQSSLTGDWIFGS